MFEILEGVIGESVEDSEKTQQFSTIEQIGAGIVNFMVAVSASLSIIGLIYATIQFVMSQGDPKLIDKAKQAITWSAVAAVGSVLLFAIKTVAINAMGITDPAFSGEGVEL